MEIDTRKLNKGVDRQQVVAMREQGMTFRGIARELGIDPSTVRYHVANADKDKPATFTKPTANENIRPLDFAPTPDSFNRLTVAKLPDTVLVLPDLQFPYAHPDALAFLSMVAQRYKPDTIIGIGDEVDAFFLSAYEKDPEALEATREYERALEYLDKLYDLFPKVLALHSNHGRGRLEKARVRAGMLRSMVADYQTFIKAPKGWGFYDEIRMGDVLFMHGDGEKALNRPFLERHVPADYGRHYSVVHGHRHEMIGRQAEITVGDNSYWCAYTGALINPHAPAFSYTKARKAKLGCGIITHGEWKQVRLKLDEQKRWIGSL